MDHRPPTLRASITNRSRITKTQTSSRRRHRPSAKILPSFLTTLPLIDPLGRAPCDRSVLSFDWFTCHTHIHTHWPWPRSARQGAGLLGRGGRGGRRVGEPRGGLSRTPWWSHHEKRPRIRNASCTSHISSLGNAHHLPSPPHYRNKLQPQCTILSPLTAATVLVELTLASSFAFTILWISREAYYLNHSESWGTYKGDMVHKSIFGKII